MPDLKIVLPARDGGHRYIAMSVVQPEQADDNATSSMIASLPARAAEAVAATLAAFDFVGDLNS